MIALGTILGHCKNWKKCIEYNRGRARNEDGLGNHNILDSRNLNAYPAANLIFMCEV